MIPPSEAPTFTMRHKVDLVKLLGDELVEHREEDGWKTVGTRAALQDRYVALYFSANWCPPCHALKFTKKTGAVLQSSKLKVQRKETTWNALKSTKKAGAREKRKLSQKVGGRKQPPRRCQRCRSQLFELQEVLPYVRSGRLYHL